VFRTEAERQDFYTQLKTAAESGWDFSTRWYIMNSTNKGEHGFRNIHITSFLPRRNVSTVDDRQDRLLSFEMLGKDIFHVSDVDKIDEQT
jgi:neutral trehalase